MIALLYLYRLLCIVVIQHKVQVRGKKMQFTVDRAILGRALDHIQGVIEQRHTQNLLSYIRLKAVDDFIELTGTDKEVFIQEKIVAEISEAGETIIPARLAHEIVRKLPDGAIVEVTIAEDRVQLKAGTSRFNLNLLDMGTSDDNSGFPTPEEGPFSAEFTMSSEDFSNAVKAVKMAVSNDTMRHYLNGIYLHHSHGSLCFVATDGHRLAYFAGKCPNGAEKIPGVIVPKKAVLEMMKLCDAYTQDVLIKVSEKLIRFELDNITLTSKLIGGEFPDYERVIPQDNDRKMQVESMKLRRVVERVNVFSDESSAVRLNVGQNLLELSTRSQEAGEARDEIEVDYESEALEIGYNAKYLLDITDNISGKVEFAWLNSSAATIIRDTDKEQVLYVLMPMRV